MSVCLFVCLTVGLYMLPVAMVWSSDDSAVGCVCLVSWMTSCISCYGAYTMAE